MNPVAAQIGLLCVLACSCTHLYTKESGKAGRIKLLQDSPLDNSEDSNESNYLENHQLPGSGSNGQYVEGISNEDNGSEGMDGGTDIPLSMAHDGTSEEGMPVKLEQWWSKIHLTKTALVILLALTETVACTALGWNIIINPSDSPILLEYSLMVAYWVGRLCLGLYSRPASADFQLFLPHVTPSDDPHYIGASIFRKS